MSSAVNEIQVENIDHLGIVAGIVDEMGLVEQVDEEALQIELLKEGIYGRID